MTFSDKESYFISEASIHLLPGSALRNNVPRGACWAAPVAILRLCLQDVLHMQVMPTEPETIEWKR